MSKLHLLALIAGRRVAIDSDQVESVVDLGPVTPVPRAAPHVCGLAALRSRVVTVIEPARALGLPAGPIRPGRAVIVQADGHFYAVLVDALEDVAPFDLAPLTCGLRLEAGWGAVARGLVEHEGAPVLVIDAAALVALTPPESLAA